MDELLYKEMKEAEAMLARMLENESLYTEYALNAAKEYKLSTEAKFYFS